MRRVVVFNYDSRFWKDIIRVIREYNTQFPEKAFLFKVYKALECPSESVAGPVDMIIHSGGDGKPVKEDVEGIPKLYICHSHQWKAKKNGGKVLKLRSFIKGIQAIDVLEDDEVLGKRGRMPIMKYHSLVVTEPPFHARVLAKSKIVNEEGVETEIIEALRYEDGSVSVQGHPEEGAAAHIFYNFFDRGGGDVISPSP